MKCDWKAMLVNKVPIPVRNTPATAEGPFCLYCLAKRQCTRLCSSHHPPHKWWRNEFQGLDPLMFRSTPANIGSPGQATDTCCCRARRRAGRSRYICS
jgi:hypothetical protein